MNLLLKAAQLYIPGFIRKKKLKELCAITAQAFGSDAPDFRGLSYSESLEAYARFTQAQAEKAMRQKTDLETLKSRLFQNALSLGQKLRRDFHIKTQTDVLIMSRILYRMLSIDFQGSASGEVTITRCYFSAFYSSQVCQIISALDEGVTEGLSGSGGLVFHERITEGNACCRATFRFGGAA